MFTASKLSALFALCAASWAYASTPALRVCADPNNLPYSNSQQKGFENEIANLFAKDLGMQVTYFWFPQREAFFRKTLNSGACDVVMGVPSGLNEASTTRPYYRSTYVFITRKDRDLHITSVDDPRLRTLKIGVHVLGDEKDSLPPVHALTRRGIVQNLVGYSIFGHLDEKNPPADLIKAVEDRQVDVAVAWGPLAGYFARRSSVPLEILPIEKDLADPQLPFSFDIAVGVREGDPALRDRLDAEVARRHAAIEQILRSFGIPQVALPAADRSTGE
ncbi:MAG TPA: substrate-binding domain-containing protein [Silvibacterium sp.]|nr:substrate-binding domain-containing protein [Silvibacterium sp.]